METVLVCHVSQFNGDTLMRDVLVSAMNVAFLIARSLNRDVVGSIKSVFETIVFDVILHFCDLSMSLLGVTRVGGMIRMIGVTRVGSRIGV